MASVDAAPCPVINSFVLKPATVVLPPDHHRTPRTSFALLLCCGCFVLAACRGHRSWVGGDSGVTSASLASSGVGGSSSVPPAPASAASPAVSAPVAPAQPSGQAHLILERVDTKSECGGGLVGYDVLLESKSGDEPLHREHVFCPEGPHGPTPSLDMFRMCRAFPRCQVVEADAGGGVELSCGKEHVRLASSGQGTTLSGSFGERQVAAFPMTLAIEKRWRTALVDC